jgi:hypothetical protein
MLQSIALEMTSVAASSGCHPTRWSDSLSMLGSESRSSVSTYTGLRAVALNRRKKVDIATDVMVSSSGYSQGHIMEDRRGTRLRARDEDSIRSNDSATKVKLSSFRGVFRVDGRIDSMRLEKSARGK